MKRGKRFSFEVEPYHYEVQVFYCVSPRTISKFIKNFTEEKLIADDSNFQAYILTEKGGRQFSIVYIGERVKYCPVDMGYVAHEAFHVAQFLCNASGVRLGGEATAYLVQHITQRILEAIT